VSSWTVVQFCNGVVIMNQQAVQKNDETGGLKKLQRYFRAKLKDPSMIVKRKAVLLIYMNITVALLVLPVPPLVYVLRGDIMRPLALALPPLVGCLFSLFILRRGYYNAAANITSLAATLTVIIGIAYQLIETPLMGYSSMIYLAPAVIVFTSLFCTRAWTTVLFIIFAGTDIALFVKIKVDGVIDFQVAQTGMIDSLLTIMFTFAIALLIAKLSRDAINDVKLENDKNKNQYNRIKGIFNSVNSISVELAHSSNDMASTSQNFSESTQNQAASSEEITSAIEEVQAAMDLQAENVEDQFKNLEVLMERMNLLSDSIQKMHDLIEGALSLSEDTSEKSMSGEKSLDMLQEAMGEISAKSQQMNSVVDVINDISEQISLLSLNASIEAARAGDAGRGFAVVADEVSKLAVQTSDSLKEISQLIAATENMVGKGMNSVDDTVHVMGGTINNISSISDKMKEINQLMEVQFELNTLVGQHSNSVHDKTSDIKISTHEQHTAISEVSRSINVINEATQSIASASIQLLDASKTVSTMADSLKERVSDF